MAQAYLDVPAEKDQEPKKAPKKANLESTQTSSPQKFESGLTGPAGRKQSQSRDETEIQRRNETGVTTAFHLPSDGACTGFSML